MPLRSRCLLLLPLLLLVPLGVLKWRADHPPLSAMDRFVQATLNQVPVLYVGGEGSPNAFWEQMTGQQAMGQQRWLAVKGHDALAEIAEALRCSEREVPLKWPHEEQGCIKIIVPLDGRTNHPQVYLMLKYSRDSQGTYLSATDSRGLVSPPRVAVQTALHRVLKRC